jgi:two-component sensor histidine kinase
MHREAVAMANDATAISMPEGDQVQKLLADGRGQRVSAAALVRALLQPYTTAGLLVGIDIEDVQLRSEAASTLARVIQELATNAARHGTLSTPDGRVSVTGRLERDNGTEALGLTWLEQGGPPVRAPDGSEFGAIISRAVTDEHGGRADLSWREEGLFYELRLPLA